MREQVLGVFVCDFGFMVVVVFLFPSLLHFSMICFSSMETEQPDVFTVYLRKPFDKQALQRSDLFTGTRSNSYVF